MIRVKHFINFRPKHKLIKVISFNTDMSIIIRYYKRNGFNPNFLVNDKHVFNHKGYTTMIINDRSTETINPLDFESKYPKEKFQAAINSKVIDDIFVTLKPKKFDMTQILLIANFALIAVVLLLLLQMSDII